MRFRVKIGLVLLAVGVLPVALLGFAVRRSDAGNVLGSSGELYWAGAPSGAAFWIDPRQELVIVFLAQATWVDYGEYRKAVKSIVESAVVE